MQLYCRPLFPGEQETMMINCHVFYENTRLRPIAKYERKTDKEREREIVEDKQPAIDFSYVLLLLGFIHHALCFYSVHVTNVIV